MYDGGSRESAFDQTIQHLATEELDRLEAEGARLGEQPLPEELLYFAKKKVERQKPAASFIRCQRSVRISLENALSQVGNSFFNSFC
jgi:hypothetical protein